MDTLISIAIMLGLAIVIFGSMWTIDYFADKL